MNREPGPQRLVEPPCLSIFVFPARMVQSRTPSTNGIAKSQPQICSDIGYHMAITGWNESIFNEMGNAVEMGVNSFKHFMAYKGALMIEDDEMYASFNRCRELGALPMVHAENGDIVAELQAKYLKQGITGPEGHAYSRPPEVEGEAANRAIMIADAASVPLYIVHVSCEQAHEAIRRARQKGMRVYGEPLIQFLTLDESEYFSKDWEHAARRVMSPPFRNKGTSGWSLERTCSWFITGGCHGSCSLHDRAKAYGTGQFHSDSQWNWWFGRKIGSSMDRRC